jgi:rubrerythrin
MPTLTPTYDTGAMTMAIGLVAPPPERTIDESALAAAVTLPGYNVPFVLGMLSQVLAHERCGTHLYRSVAARSNNPMLKRKYEQFGEQTERHATLVEELITVLGGDPQYVSPAARAIEGSDTKLLESTWALEGSVDLMTAESVMLTAVMIAESVDHANWELLSQMAPQMPEGEVRDTFTRITAEVEDEEDEHLTWARETRARITMMQAKSSAMASVGMKAEEMMAQVKSWFD